MIILEIQHPTRETDVAGYLVGDLSGRVFGKRHGHPVAMKSRSQTTLSIIFKTAFGRFFHSG
jgi:hypothetical protein